MKKITLFILCISLFTGLAIISCKTTKKETSNLSNASAQYVGKICVSNGMGNNIDFYVKITGGAKSNTTSCFSVGKQKCINLKDAISGIQPGDEIGPKVETCGCIPNISKWGPDVYYSSNGGTATYTTKGTCFGNQKVILN